MRAIGIICLVALSGCASVSFRQLEPGSLAARPGAPEGAVYYLPRPYLLVARATPADAPSAARPAQVANIPPPAGSGRARRGRSLPSTLDYAPMPVAGGGDDSAPAAAATSALGATDTGFGLAVGNYIIKLVYLPDRSRPMSMSVRGGLFGVGSLQPTLQNGWMLTNFTASADNSHFSDVLTAVAGLLNTSVIGGSSTAAETDGGGGGGAAAEERRENRDHEVLRPGLYDFDFDPETGRLTRLCAVSFFTDRGVVRGDCGR